MFYETKFILALFLTILIETIIVILLTKYFIKIKKFRLGNVIFASVLASALTLPYLWFILPSYISSWINYMIMGEISVFLIESLIYHKILETNWKNSLLISFIANLTSFLLGLILM
jgi:hypothetical protein